MSNFKTFVQHGARKRDDDAGTLVRLLQADPQFKQVSVASAQGLQNYVAARNARAIAAVPTVWRKYLIWSGRENERVDGCHAGCNASKCSRYSSEVPTLTIRNCGVQRSETSPGGG